MSRTMSRQMSLRPPPPAPLGRWRSAVRGASSANTRLSIAIRIVPRATPSTSAAAACVSQLSLWAWWVGGIRALGELIRWFQPQSPRAIPQMTPTDKKLSRKMNATKKMNRQMSTAPCGQKKMRRKMNATTCAVHTFGSCVKTHFVNFTTVLKAK